MTHCYNLSARRQKTPQKLAPPCGPVFTKSYKTKQ